MTSPIPVFDGQNDLLLRLMKTLTPREETWLGTTGRGHLDLARMKAAGFAGGLPGIFGPRSGRLLLARLNGDPAGALGPGPTDATASRNTSPMERNT